MSLPQLSSDDIVKLRKLVDEGVRVKAEIKDLNESLKDTVNSLAEELDIPAKTIRKAITVAFKDNMEEVKEEVSDAEDLLEVVKNKNIASI